MPLFFLFIIFFSLFFYYYFYFFSVSPFISISYLSSSLIFLLPQLLTFDSLQRVFNLRYCIVHYRLIFLSFMSLLNICCIFSILSLAYSEPGTLKEFHRVIQIKEDRRGREATRSRKGRVRKERSAQAGNQTPKWKWIHKIRLNGTKLNTKDQN